jgi:hypothetical protein
MHNPPPNNGKFCNNHGNAKSKKLNRTMTDKLVHMTKLTKVMAWSTVTQYNAGYGSGHKSLFHLSDLTIPNSFLLQTSCDAQSNLLSQIIKAEFALTMLNLDISFVLETQVTRPEVNFNNQWPV